MKKVSKCVTVVHNLENIHWIVKSHESFKGYDFVLHSGGLYLKMSKMVFSAFCN